MFLNERGDFQGGKDMNYHWKRQYNSVTIIIVAQLHPETMVGRGVGRKVKLADSILQLHTKRFSFSIFILPRTNQLLYCICHSSCTYSIGRVQRELVNYSKYHSTPHFLNELLTKLHSSCSYMYSTWKAWVVFCLLASDWMESRVFKETLRTWKNSYLLASNMLTSITVDTHRIILPSSLNFAL